MHTDAAQSVRRRAGGGVGSRPRGDEWSVSPVPLCGDVIIVMMPMSRTWLPTPYLPRAFAAVAAALLFGTCGTHPSASRVAASVDGATLPSAGLGPASTASASATATTALPTVTAVPISGGGGSPGTTSTTNLAATTTSRARLTSTTTMPPPPLAGGVFGNVTAGPTCPVENVTNPCPPRPVSALVVAADRYGKVVASTTSSADGDYALALAPGTYDLTVNTGSVFPRCPTLAVTVSQPKRARVDISCDTGIR